MKSRIFAFLLVLIILLASSTVAQDAPRLTEAEVRKLADSKVPWGEESLYTQQPPFYVASAKAWQVRYSPKQKKDSTGKQIAPISIWVDDATGNVSRSK